MDQSARVGVGTDGRDGPGGHATQREGREKDRRGWGGEIEMDERRRVRGTRERQRAVLERNRGGRESKRGMREGGRQERKLSGTRELQLEPQAHMLPREETLLAALRVYLELTSYIEIIPPTLGLSHSPCSF